MRKLSNEGSPIITREDIKLVFSEIEAIHSSHAQFLQDLQMRLDRWSPSQRISDLFDFMVRTHEKSEKNGWQKQSRSLALYTVYTNNMTQAEQRVQDYLTMPNYMKWLHEKSYKTDQLDSL